MAAKTIPVRGHGQITIPKRLREQLNLEEGDLLEVEIAPEGILLKPRKLIDPSQAWFWTKAWQESEREADEAIGAGRVKRFKNPAELIRGLHRHKKR